MDVKKAAHVAAAFVLLGGSGNITKLKLMKLMYLAERESLNWRGFPMIYDNLVCMKAGPVLSHTLNLINYQRPSGEWQNLLKKPDARSHRMCVLNDGTTRTDLDQLSQNDEVIIDKVWERFGGWSANRLSGYTHTLPEYVAPPAGSSRGLRYYDVLTNLGRPTDDARELADDIDYYQTLNL